ncbi:hypothetical protein N7492_002468 [Penicillium capsulatum]|uniref:Nuclear RNA binding protein n=1 Tax=Penicillium capsulatum TaxID=69766 RepID=A0A9W9LV63_9EURO|nr:hypothetical protein N7492_002468 [Penicillium capsulatum]KAJ6122928.1 hypothetical protein N7512_005393 [Penicillium capsulatum]
MQRSGPDEMDIDPNPAEPRSSRKHLRSSDDEDLDWSSDISGRFDDAEETDPDDYKSPSVKSAKRRRSNDWPLPDEAADYGSNNAPKSRGNGHLAVNYIASPRASPRTSATSLRSKQKAASHSPRHFLGRRSRFVEANMNDSVSETPPSIFTHERKQPQLQHRQSGIFRFGKAIASAFNPFGGWGRSSPEPTKASPQKDALTQAEEAYAELKKAGFKGTNKGSYMQQQSVDPELADQTWKIIQEKMGYTRGTNPTYHCGNHKEQPSPLRSPSKNSKRSSFQDLRKTKSLFKPHESTTTVESTVRERTSDDSDQLGIRRQKSRKELSRQAKLLKKVSNLEDKLGRARRELHELTGNEERLPESIPEPKSLSAELDPASFPRKFVPGSLPSLPSERLLDQQASPEPPAIMQSVEGRSSAPREESASSPVVGKSPKWRSRETRPSSMGKESSSLKRKSPIPEAIASRDSAQSSPTNYAGDRIRQRERLIDDALLSPPRQAKWQKFEAGDSPGSVERKQHMTLGTAITTQEAAMHKRSPYLHSRRSPGLNRSPNSKAVRSPPPLRMRRGQSNLRSVSPSEVTLLDPTHSDHNDYTSPPPMPSEGQQGFYLQSHRQLDPDRTPRSSPSRPSLARKRSSRSSFQDEDIPPVPPLPKELLKDAAKVSTSPKKASPALELSEPQLSPRPSSLQKELAGLEDFLWPEDVF